MMVEERNKKGKRIIMLISTTLFALAFLINVLMKEALFNYNLNVVPQLQNNSFLGSDAFIFIMNIFSNIFNPIICAGYIILFYLFSYRKLQILVFLIWFIFLSSALSFLKEFIQEPRPFWVEGSDVQMLQWTCYTQYGCPSGHAMLGLVLIEFIVRFYARGTQTVKNKIAIFYGIGIIIQGLVVFSRIILGMHSLNQVSFGLLLGFYSFIPYYLYIEKYILKLCFFLNKSYYKFYILFIIAMMILFFMSIEIIITYALNYDNDSSWRTIKSFEKCEDVQIFRSFQFRCFQDSALIMSAFGIMYALVFINKPQNLMKVPTYPRMSKKFIIKVIIILVISLLPVIIFLNPLWTKISLNTDDLSLLVWFLYCCGLFLGMFFLVFSPYFTEKARLEEYSDEIAIEPQRKSSRKYSRNSERKSKELTIRETQYLQKRISQQQSLEIPK